VKKGALTCNFIFPRNNLLYRGQNRTPVRECIRELESAAKSAAIVCGGFCRRTRYD